MNKLEYTKESTNSLLIKYYQNLCLEKNLDIQELSVLYEYSFQYEKSQEIIQRIIPIVLNPINGDAILIDLFACRSSDISDSMRKLIEGHSGKICFGVKRSVKSLHALGITMSGPFFDIELADQILKGGLNYKRKTMNDIIMKYLGEYVEDANYEVDHFLQLRDVMTAKLKANNLIETMILKSIKSYMYAVREVSGVYNYRGNSSFIRGAQL